MGQHGLSQFLKAVDLYRLPVSRLWFAGIAVQSLQQQTELLFGRLVLVTPGDGVPDVPEGRIVENALGVVASGYFPPGDIEAWFSAMDTNRVPDGVLQLFGRSVVMPGNKSGEPSWSVSDNVRSARGGNPRILAERCCDQHAYERFGYEAFDRLDAALKVARPEAFDGVGGFAARSRLTKADEFKNYMARPFLEISADLRLKIRSFAYVRSDRGYRVDIEAGVGLPLSAASVSFMPGRHPQMQLDTFEPRRAERGVLHVTNVLSSPWKDTPLKASLQYAGAIVGEATDPGKKDGTQISSWAKGIARPDDVDSALRKRFDRRWRQVAGALGRVLPPHVIAPAKQRLRDAVELLETRPFYSIVASGSVVEALLVERLRRVGKARLKRRAIEMGLSFPKLNNWPEPSLSDCVDVVESLKLMEGMEVNGLDAVREARNHVHLSRHRVRRRGFAESDAVSALGCAFGLLDVLMNRRTILAAKRRSKFKRIATVSVLR